MLSLVHTVKSGILYIAKNRAPKKERGSFFVSLIYLFDKSLIWCTQVP